jgi:hypothetical protein
VKLASFDPRDGGYPPSPEQRQAGRQPHLLSGADTRDPAKVIAFFGAIRGRAAMDAERLEIITHIEAQRRQPS